MIGETVSHYRIVSQLGSGGMGVVYRAEDSRLGRSLALKFLPDDAAGDREALERFRREARAASALNHPNICTIYEIDEHEGRPFIAMELLEGESLFDRLSSGVLTLDEIVRYGMQIADALEAAHGAGMIHRDIKPGNVFITSRDQAKVLDFGLAKSAGADAGDVDIDATAMPTATVRREPLTREGAALGTVCYMSPEQARGEPLDRRTDLFSLGAVLYEASAGRRAFGGNTTAVIYDAVLHGAPPPLEQVRPELQPELGHIIRKALEKDRALRYQSAAEIRADLKRLRRDTEASRAGMPPSSGTAVATPAARRWNPGWVLAAALLVTIALVVLWTQRGAPEPAAAPQGPVTFAVLPLENLGAGEDLAYLSLAVPDDITTALSHVRGLSVRPFSMTRRFVDGPDPATVAEELGVDHLLTGHFAQEGEDIRVSLEVMDVRDSRLLWKRVLTVEPGGFLSLHQRLSREVEAGLLPALGVSPALDAGTRPVNPEAYELYLRALALGREPEPASEAQQLLLRAVELDPQFAPAWVQLGDTYYDEVAFFAADMVAERRGRQKAREAVERALALDPGLIAGAQRLVVLDTEEGRLEEAYDQAAALVVRRPDSASAHFSLSYVYRYAGLLDRAARHCDIALSLDPSDPGLRSCHIVFLLADELARSKTFLNLDDNSTWYEFNRITSLLHAGDAAGARDQMHRARSMSGNSGVEPWLLDVCVERGSAEELQAAARRERAVFVALQDPEPALFLALRMAYCGLEEDALELLQLIVAKRYCMIPAMETHPFLATVRKLPGYAGLRSAGQSCQRSFLTHLERTEQSPGT